MKYRKKPVVIDALLYVGNDKVLAEWMYNFDNKVSSDLLEI